MSLMAVFNCSFFIILILFLLIIGLIWIHFNTKINNQNINMNQMVRLLTTMTQEVSLLRKKVGLSSNDEIIDISEEEIKDDKITVSDDDLESDSDDESDDNSNDNSDDDSEDESEDETDDDSNDNTPIELLQLKEIKTEKLNKLEEQLEESEIQLNKLEEQLNKLEEDKLEEPEQQFNKLEEVKLDQPEEQPEEQTEEQPEEEIEEKQEEYKKMSLNKLKTLVLEKKLISDVSKLKKNDLLTILGIEV